MRIRANQTKTQGSVLLITLMTAWVIGISLVSYLTLVANLNRRTYHSHSWTACIPILEAGIEEALTQLNYNNGEGLNNATAHGWTVAMNGVCFKRRDVGTDGGYFVVTIDPNASATPVITSQGYVPAPGNTGTPMGGENAFGMILATVTGQSTPAMISRTVRLGTVLQNAGGGQGGINTKGTILFNGGGSLDSFDSSDPNYSTNGKYDSTKRKANGRALSNSSAADAIHVDNSYIYGSVTTGPGGGTVSINGGSVGDAAWNASNPNTGLARIQTGHQTGDANVQFDDPAEPFLWGSGSTPVAASAGGTNYNYVVDGAINTKWNLPGGVNIGLGKSMIITGGDVTLYVNGNFTTLGSGFVYVAPGASLKLYVAGTLNVYGLGTATSNWIYSGSSGFIGTVYSPHNNFTFSGSAGAFGSFSANTVTISGGASLHYDETLSGSIDPVYVASSWNEI